MCKWYCTSNGPSTDLACLHCRAHYCAACLHGDGGKMESLIKCASCGKKPRVQPAASRSSWKGESTSGSTAAGPAYTPSSALKQASHASASMRINPSPSPTSRISTKASPKKILTSSSSPAIFDRLTDPSLYTGTHQHRFAPDGRGLGLDGRDSPSKGQGATPAPRTLDASHVDLSAILRPDAKYSPVSSDSALRAQVGKAVVGGKVGGSGGKGKAGGGPSIFDKLTDSSQYTGAHRARFDMAGNGRGMAGRDAASGTEYGGGRVTSLSQITRTNLR